MSRISLLVYIKKIAYLVLDFPPTCLVLVKNFISIFSLCKIFRQYFWSLKKLKEVNHQPLLVFIPAREMPFHGLNNTIETLHHQNNVIEEKNDDLRRMEELQVEKEMIDRHCECSPTP